MIKGVDDIAGLVISQASLEDLDELEALERRAFSVPWSRKAFEAELSGNEFSLILIARYAGASPHVAGKPLNERPRVVGYICAWTVFEELRFMNIAVEADMRRRGIGSELLKKIMEIGISHGTQRALLEVRKSNDSAQALYARFGFTSYGARRDYYTNPTEDAMLMSLEPLTLSRTII
ncbi:MAG: ribosomal-protein-alanine acetyltransferase [Nitrospirales bacterium]|nr:MAG: ribosomal-protein-alanine acetyltransferase [Nitrospirales bacterium]